MLRLSSNILAIVEWRSRPGREVDRQERASWCETCPAQLDVGVTPQGKPYTSECEQAGHARGRQVEVTTRELAPDETKRLGAIKRRLEAVFKVAYHCGGSVYLIPASRMPQVNEGLAAVRAELDQANGEMRVCRARYNVRLAEVDPGLAHTETLQSIKSDIEDALARILEAIQSGDPGRIREVLRETNALSGLVEGTARTGIEDLNKFAAGIAKRLRDAAKEGETFVERVEQIHAEARAGAVRFAGIFQEMGAQAEAAA